MTGWPRSPAAHRARSDKPYNLLGFIFGYLSAKPYDIFELRMALWISRIRVIFCRVCEIALPDKTVRCPMCQRHLRAPVALVSVGLVLVCVLLSGLLWGSGRLKNKVEGWEVSREDVLKTVQSLVATNPAVHNPVAFSGSDQTLVEHWDGRRWRVSGYVDTRPQPGVKVRTLYFAVLLENGKTWELEDLQLQSMEFGPGPATRGN